VLYFSGGKWKTRHLGEWLGIDEVVSSQHVAQLASVEFWDDHPFISAKNVTEIVR
jgi:hypothetical protein